MKKDKRFSLRLRTYYLLIIAIVVIISFGAVVGALTALQQLGVIGHINVSTLVALLLVAAAATHFSNQNDIRVLTERRIKPLIIALYVHAHLALVDDRLRRFIDILDRVFQRNHMERTILVDLI